MKYILLILIIGTIIGGMFLAKYAIDSQNVAGIEGVTVTDTGAVTKEFLFSSDIGTESGTSSSIDIRGAKRVTLSFARQDNTEGSSLFSVWVSSTATSTYTSGSTTPDGYIRYNKLIDNVTNTNSQNLTRVNEANLSSSTNLANGTSTYSMELIHDVFSSMLCVASTSVDGTSYCRALIEF